MKITTTFSRARVSTWILTLLSTFSISHAMEVSRTYPEDGALGVGVNQTVLIVFSDAIDASQLDEAEVRIEEPDMTTPTYTATVIGKRLLVQFDQPFRQSGKVSFTASKYTLVLENVVSRSGAVMRPYRFSFFIESPKFPAFQIDSKQYSGHCLAVKNQSNRFSKAYSWRPVVELQACDESGKNNKQLWFLSKSAQDVKRKRLHWVEDFNYCLVDKGEARPSLERCSEVRDEQVFNFINLGHDIKMRNTNSERCLASANLDRGKINKVVTSPCHFPIARNRWTVKSVGLRELSEPFWLGATDLRYAKIRYKNPKFGVDLDSQATRDLVKRLYLTRALNHQASIDELGLSKGVNAGEEFELDNVYYPRNENNAIPLPKPRSVIIDGIEVTNPEAYDNTNEGYDIGALGGVQFYQQEVATRWWSNYTRGLKESQRVCAVKFVDEAKNDYNLQTFESAQQARMAGWQITHLGHCGACSTLKDLAVYMGVPDQTTPTRLCTKRGRGQVNRLDEVKACLINAVGFNERCAESWAYNGQHSSTECQATCLRTYGKGSPWPLLEGFINVVIAEKFDACPPEVATPNPDLRLALQAQGCPLENEITGKLNACIYCDERVSGPGFKYSSGRTRRNSGLESAIPRFYDAIRYDADHTAYFD